MLTIYDDHGDVSMTLDIQPCPAGWRVARELYSGPRVFSRDEQYFPSRGEAREFAQVSLQTARMWAPARHGRCVPETPDRLPAEGPGVPGDASA